MQKNDNKGFSLIELVISIAILLVLMGMAVHSFGNTRINVQEKRYMLEASAVFEAVNLYLFDSSLSEEFANSDLTDIYLELMEALDERNHVLKPYLSGKTTKGACIKLLEMPTEVSIVCGVDTMEYLTGEYLIEVRSGGEITILSYPEYANQSKRK